MRASAGRKGHASLWASVHDPTERTTLYRMDEQHGHMGQQRCDELGGESLASGAVEEVVSQVDEDHLSKEGR